MAAPRVASYWRSVPSSGCRSSSSALVRASPTWWCSSPANSSTRSSPELSLESASAHRVNLLRADSHDQPHLVTTSVPGVGAEVLLGQLLDVFFPALGRSAHDKPADFEVPRWIGRVADVHSDTRISLDVFHLLVSLNSVDDDAFTIGVDPCLGELG